MKLLPQLLESLGAFIEPYRGTLFHGIITADSWERIGAGVLELPTMHAIDVHDLGSYGAGMYFTTSLSGAKSVARRQGKKFMIVKAKIELENALWIDARGKHPFLKGSPGKKIFDFLTTTFGNTMRGVDVARMTAAVAWREGLLAEGIDGIVIHDDYETDVVVYDPEEAVVDYGCFLLS